MQNVSRFFSVEENALSILIDPDKFSADKIPVLKNTVEKLRPAYFFVGGSFLFQGDTDETVELLKKHFSLPVILFPGDYTQLTPKADALLFLSLLSGRNPEFLAGQQVKAAPYVEKYRLKSIPVAYLLIEGGHVSTAQYVTQTIPIPQDKSALVTATALAGQYMGMQAVYLEAGSGAAEPVSLDLVKKVRKKIQIPLIVGGGIEISQINAYFKAGANVVVIGTEIEKILK